MELVQKMFHRLSAIILGLGDIFVQQSKIICLRMCFFFRFSKRYFLLFAICVVILAIPITWGVRFTAQSGFWWNRGFDSHEAENKTGLSRSEIQRVGSELRNYFLNDDLEIHTTVYLPNGTIEQFFSARETEHLIDVKHLLNRTYEIGWASLGITFMFLLAILLIRERNVRLMLAKTTMHASLMASITIIALGCIAVAGFGNAFRDFHLIFFTNDLWKLSSEDRLIQLFPQSFFFETTMLIGVLALAFPCFIWGGCWLYQRKQERH